MSEQPRESSAQAREAANEILALLVPDRWTYPAKDATAAIVQATIDAALAERDAGVGRLREALAGEAQERDRADRAEAALAATLATLANLLWCTNILGERICDLCGETDREAGREDCACRLLRAALAGQPP